MIVYFAQYVELIFWVYIWKDFSLLKNSGKNFSQVLIWDIQIFISAFSVSQSFLTFESMIFIRLAMEVKQIN